MFYFLPVFHLFRVSHNQVSTYPWFRLSKTPPLQDSTSPGLYLSRISPIHGSTYLCTVGFHLSRISPIHGSIYQGFSYPGFHLSNNSTYPGFYLSNVLLIKVSLIQGFTYPKFHLSRVLLCPLNLHVNTHGKYLFVLLLSKQLVCSSVVQMSGMA